MAYTTIDDPSKYFQPVLFTGSTSNITVNIDMRPDWFWFKSRTQTYSHLIYDTSRPSDGTSMPSGDVNMYNVLKADKDVVESDNNADGLVQTSTGFIVDGDGQAISEANQGTNNMACWVWKANGGTRTTNTESGNNPAGGFQANTTAGFSIVDYTGTGAAGTMAHGLGAVPHMIIFKARSQASNDWAVYHHGNTSAPETDFLRLNTTDATTDNSNFMNDTAPTSSVFTVGTGSKVNTDGETYIAYCFTEKQGYSKFGKYTSNNNANGPFVYTGFKPSFVMTKINDGGGTNWRIYDSKRQGFNKDNDFLMPNSSAVENSAASEMDLLSNGFKLVQAEGDANFNTSAVIYMAFAETPFVSSKGVPTTAR